ncbi:MAG: hypothetical protein ACK5PF_08560 [bacterium]
MRERLPLSAVYKKKQKAKKKGSEKDDTGIRTRDLTHSCGCKKFITIGYALSVIMKIVKFES